MTGIVEQELLRDGNVVITTARISIDSTMYPVAGITAVQTTRTPGARRTGIGMVVLGALMTPVFPVAGVPLAALGLVLAIWSKDKHALRLATAGGQVDALVSTDAARVARLAAALGDAIARR
jgi:hypothetical protein